MTIGKGKRPRDTNQLAKFIVDVTTGQADIPDPNAGESLPSTAGLTDCAARVAPGSSTHLRPCQWTAVRTAPFQCWPHCGLAHAEAGS